MRDYKAERTPYGFSNSSKIQKIREPENYEALRAPEDQPKKYVIIYVHVSELTLNRANQINKFFIHICFDIYGSQLC